MTPPDPPVTERAAPEAHTPAAPAASEPPTATVAQPWGWHALRVSGLFLAALLVWHVVVSFVTQDVGQVTAVTVSNHWRDTTWRALEWVTLVLALAHGALGVDTLLRGAGGLRPAGRTAARIASASLLGALAVAATVVVLTYR